MTWNSSTLTLWRDNYVLPGIESSLTPPDQWRDQTCECSVADPHLKRGSRSVRKFTATQKKFDEQIRSLFDVEDSQG